MIHLLEAPRSSADFSRNSFAAKQRNDFVAVRVRSSRAVCFRR